MRLFFHVAYNGFNYRGWQRQPNVPSVQETFETALEKILKQKIVCIGCGRTDAQVHASQYFFHIEIKEELDINIIPKLNNTLPDDLTIYEIFSFDERRHAQFDAIERHYDYFIHTTKQPFLHRHSTYLPYGKWDIKKIQTAIRLIPGKRDFRSFCKSPDKHDNTICNVKNVSLFLTENNTRMQFKFEANRYVKSMIRLLVGNVLEVGKGKLSLKEFQALLDVKSEPRHYHFAPPQGLYLSKVIYPFLETPPRNHLDYSRANP